MILAVLLEEETKPQCPLLYSIDATITTKLTHKRKAKLDQILEGKKKVEKDDT